MPSRVRHRLERDPVGGDLHRGGQALELVGRVDLDAWMVGGAELLGLLPQRTDEPELVERGRAERVHEPAHVGDRVLDLRARVLEQRAGSGRLGDEQVLGRFDLERGARECRSEAVVEIAAQAPALLLSGGHQALPRPLQLRGLGDEGLVQSPAKARPRPAAFVPVHQPVHAALQRRAQRLNEKGDEPGRDEREPEVGALLYERGETADEEHVDRHDAHGQAAVDERAIDQEIDVVEAVAEDRDADREREAEDGEEDERVGDVVRPDTEGGPETAQDEQRGGQACGVRKPLDLLALDPLRPAEANDDRHHPCDDRAQREDRAESQKVDRDVVDPVRVLYLAAVELPGGEGLREREGCDSQATDPGHDAPAPREKSPVREVERHVHERDEYCRNPAPVREPGCKLRHRLRAAAPPW